MNGRERPARASAFPPIVLHLGPGAVVREVSGLDGADAFARGFVQGCVGQLLESLVASDDQAALRAALVQAGAGRPVHVALRWPRGAGAAHPVELILLGAPGPGQAAQAVLRDLGPLERAERLLAASHYLTQIGLWEWELATNVVTWSEELYAIYGLRPGECEISLETFLQRVHPDDRPRVMESVQRSLEQGSGFAHSERIIRPDGSVRHLETRGETVRGRDGRVSALLGTCRDVTEDKRAEEAIRQREELLRAVMEAMPVGVGVWQADGTLRYANQRAAEIAGAAPAYRPLRAGTDDAYPRERLPTSRALAGQHAWVDDVEFVLADGRRRPVEVWSAPLRDGGANVSGAVTVFADVTERRRAEALRAGERRVLEMLGAGAPIRETLEALALVFEAQADGMLVSILLLEGERVRHGAAPSLPGEWIRVVDGQRIGPDRGSCGTAAYTGQRVIAVDVASDPRWVDFRDAALASGLRSCWSTPILARDGGVLGTFALYFREPRAPSPDQLELVDRATHVAAIVIERQQSQDALRHLNEELEARVRERTLALDRAHEAAEAANRAKSVFLANMSHEIRTPMNAVLGFTQLLQRDAGLSEEQRRRVDAIGRSGEHLLNLINEVLDMAKLESGRVELYVTTVDLAQLLDDLETMFRGRAAAKGLRMRIEAADAPAYVRTDQLKLTQILVNLLGNAIKFTDAGEVSLRLSVPSGAAGARLLAEVSDSGPGIAPEERALVFEKFAQTDAGRWRGGTGLGLPLAREYARIMGGELGFASEVGKGTTFRLEIAVEPAGGPEKGSLAAARRVVGLEAGQAPIRVLVADDRPDNRGHLTALLEAVGFEVKGVEDGAAAVAECERWRPQLVLMDLRMPVMDGCAACQHIRAAPWGADVKLVMVSASAFPRDRAAAIECGAQGFVRKPFKESELFAAIREALGVRYVFEPVAAPEAADLPSDLRIQVGALPPALAAGIQAAVRRGDAEQLQELIGQVSGAPLADALRRLAAEYDYDRILAVLGGPGD